MNSFSWSSIHYFLLEVNGGRFLSFLVAFRNTATRRHSEIKQNRSTTKQDFPGEALSKQNIKDWLTSLSCSSSRATTGWSAIFAFGVWCAQHRYDLWSASSTGWFFYWHKGWLGDWDWAKGRERELAATEEREHKERWKGEKERFLSSPWFPASLLTG